jgi:hypothetical protein
MAPPVTKPFTARRDPIMSAVTSPAATRNATSARNVRRRASDPLIVNSAVIEVLALRRTAQSNAIAISR